MDSTVSGVFLFDEFELDAARRRLSRAGETVVLNQRAIELLIALVERGGDVVSKDELLEKVWEGQFVEENNLTVQIAALRKALGDKKGENRFLLTVPGKGYQFVGTLKEQETTAIVIENRTIERITVDEVANEPRAMTGSARPLGLALAGMSAAALLLIAVGLTIWLRQPSARPFTSIAVMPFTLEGGDAKEFEYLTNGVTESLINNLSQVPKMTVKARTSVFRFKGREIDVRQVGRELEVEAVLVGRIVDRGETFAISLELVDAANGNQIWGDSYTRPKAEFATMQNDLARDVASRLRDRLAPGDAIAKGQTSNAEAYQLYLKGRYLWNNRNQADHEKALALFERAVAIDPNFALAYAGIGDVYTVDTFRLPSYAEKARRGRAAAAKALSITPDLPEALAVMAKIEWNSWNWNEAEKNFRRAIEVSPNYASAHQWYAEFLMRLGRREESLAEIYRAIELDPLSRVFYSDSIYLHAVAKQYDKAYEQARKTLEIDSRWAMAYFQRSLVNENTGRYAAALDDLDTAVEYSELPESERLRRRAESNEIRAQLEKDPARGYWTGMLAAEQRRPVVDQDCQVLAFCYLNLGDRERALSSLEKCFDDQYYPEKGFDLLKVDPAWQTLHGEPRFNAMLNKLNLAD